MHVVVSTLFHVLCFLHQEKVITIDQMAFFNSGSCTSNVPFISKTPPDYENVNVGLLKDSTLMGMFPIPPPDTPPFVTSINMISTIFSETLESYDPCIVPIPDFCLHYSDQLPLNPMELACQAIQSATPFLRSLCDTSPDTFHVIFTTYEMIMNFLYMEYIPSDDGNHHSILFLEPETIESYQQISTLSTIVIISSILESIHDVLYQGNLGNISPTIPLDISIKPGAMENVHIGDSCYVDEVRTYKSLFQQFCDVFAWSCYEMPGVDLDIVVHEIKTYLDAKPVQQRLCLVHPCKVAAIKLEVEKLIITCFVYPVALTDWVSNLVSVNKKHDMIHVCVDYRNIKKSCPKDNYPTPFVDQIFHDYAGSEIFSLMDDFSDYNQINILPTDQHKTTFIFPWGTFTCRKLPFGLKNVGVTFQHTMSYVFHDIKHIIQPYLDDLLAHSMHCQDHPTHLWAILLHCRYYHI
jgi:hypothetical protein